MTDTFLKSGYVNLTITYTMKLYPAMDKKLEELVGKETHSSGSGFGERDLSWDIRKDDTDRIVQALEGIANKTKSTFGVSLFTYIKPLRRKTARRIVKHK